MPIPSLANNHTQANTPVFWFNGFITLGPKTGQASPVFPDSCVTVIRHPGDPIYYADIELQNVVVGSRYRIERYDTGDLLAEGVAAAATILHTSQPAYSAGMLIRVKVRQATTFPKYHPFEILGILGRKGLTVWVSQVAEGILNG